MKTPAACLRFRRLSLSMLAATLLLAACAEKREHAPTGVAQTAMTPQGAAVTIDLEQVPSGRYMLVNANSGKCLDIKDAALDDGVPLSQATCVDSRVPQFFDITEVAAGVYKLVNANSGKAIDVPAGSGADHAVLQQWQDNGTGSQRFRIERSAVVDRYRLSNVNNGKCLNIAAAATSEGALLEQLACSGAASQLFKLAAGEPRQLRLPPQAPLVPLRPVPPSATYQSLVWSNDAPETRYQLADGTLVTQIGGRVRDRHAREPIVDDSYAVFPPLYFERRTHEITIYENVAPNDASQRILTVVVRPQHYWYGTNFRHGYIGRRSEDPLEPTSVALYADNGGMKVLPGGVVSRTPIANYASLAPDPNTNYAPPTGTPGYNFVLVKEIRTAANEAHRPLRTGDLVEFELGIFLAGDSAAIGRFNYYAEALVYKVGSPGVQSWFRGPAYGVMRPLDALQMPAAALSAGPLMTLQEDTSSEPWRVLVQASHNIAGYNMQAWVEGRRLLHTSFVSGAHSEESNTVFAQHANKSAPHFSQTRCVDCHAGNGKSTPLAGTALARMGVFVGALAGGIQSQDARFGNRLQQGRFKESGADIDGREGELVISAYTNSAGVFGDGTAYVLQKPTYALRDRAGATLALPQALSVRAAPSLVGLGLLEAVSEQALERLVAAQKTDPDGVRGRLQIVADPRTTGVSRVGRFGWKAGTATLEQQVSLAFNTDMGVTSPLFPKLECARGSAGADCARIDNEAAKLTTADINRTTLYLSLLGVPPRRHFDNPLEQDAAERTRQATVRRGETLFANARCTACHVTALTTGAHKFVELRRQTIHPYTDLLLHDMGAGLADTYVEGRATGSEWRTAPLWGIGTAAAIDPGGRYLHDGRAATLEQAILWHGGQAAPARVRYANLAAQDRAAMIEFLKSL